MVTLREAQLRHAQHYVEILAQADRQYLLGAENTAHGLDLFDLAWENIRVGQHWAAANASSDKDALPLCNEYPDVGLYCLNIRVHSQTWIAWLLAGLAAAQQLGDQLGISNHLGNLGSAYLNLGDSRQAIQYYDQRLVLARGIGDRRGELSTLGNLGVAYKNLGQIHKAIENYKLCLVVMYGYTAKHENVL